MAYAQTLMRIEELQSISQIWIKWQSGLENVTSFLSRAYGTLNRIYHLYFSYLVGLSSEYKLWLFVNNS